MHKLTLAVLLLLSASPLQEIAEEPVAEATLQKQEIPAKRLDPSQYEVMLPAHGEWNASLVYENDVGVWTVGIHQVIPEYGCPEVIGLDDRGRCSVMASYSGKWTRYDLVGEGQWLGGLEQADLDPRAPGTEIYTGGRMGNLYQVVHERRGVFSTRLIAHIPGREIHTLVAGDLVPSREGNEMVLFTRPGGLFLVTCEEDGAFRLRDLGDAGGRVRDAVLLPSRPGDVPTIATVARTGTVRLLRLGAEGPEWSIVHRRTMGFGRIALRPESTPESVVFYTSCDDGLVLRHAGPASGPFSTKTIYAGPQGLRGIVAGRFDSDAECETIATFGYSGKVQLLARRGDRWTARTIFVDRDKGHWLTAGELDGRNGTLEIVGSGYGKRVFLLSRPPGYGLEGVAVEPDGEDVPESWEVK
ncbi:MAG: hypothetical protein ACYTDX_07705 [Planctomycetota bacterium]|jgi:hypothetical protein